MGWRVAMAVGLSLLAANQFLVWEPWFGVTYLILDGLPTVAIAAIFSGIGYLPRIQLAIRTGLLPPGTI